MDAAHRPDRTEPPALALPARPAGERPVPRALPRRARATTLDDAHVAALRAAARPARQRPVGPAAARAASPTAQLDTPRSRRSTGARCAAPLPHQSSRKGMPNDPVRRQSDPVVLRRQPQHGACRSTRARSAPRSSTSARCTARPASSPTTRASCRRRRATRRSPTSTATRASCCTAATRSSSSR